MCASADKHFANEQWDAARKSWNKIREKAHELGARDYVARAYRGIAAAEVRLLRYGPALKMLESARKLREGRLETAAIRSILTSFD